MRGTVPARVRRMVVVMEGGSPCIGGREGGGRGRPDEGCQQNRCSLHI